MKNSDAVVELRGLIGGDETAEWISNLWVKWDSQRATQKARWDEVDKYIYATDTSFTSNKDLPWTHKARNPKLTQIRDNLHANYLSSLFPHDKWLSWVAYSSEAAKKQQAQNITSYMENKTREGGFRTTVSHLLYDYIDRGMCFAMPTFEIRYKTTDLEKTTDFIGPTAVRLDPRNIVFNPTAANFRNTPKIVRSITTLGQLKKMVDTHKDHAFLQAVIDRRREIHNAALTYSADDWSKAVQYSVDGFGNLQEYYISDTVEILDFYGDYYDKNTGILYPNRMITIADRSIVARDIDMPTYSGRDPISAVGWRLRSDNLWAQGPMDNLIGMQYQIDHYLNMAANALDLKVMPPKKVIGDVEEFEWKPNEFIHIDENGDVQEMAQQFGDIATCLEFIRQIEDRMEMYAGAPREAMGIRTPGEKTAFEVQALENAAGRIFQEKIVQFEVFLEELLNNMLEEAHKGMEFSDIIRVMDNDIGVEDFRKLTKEDITADGILRPVGARHFAQKAQELQNLVGVFNSPLQQFIAPHVSGKGLADFVNDVINLRGYKVFAPNIAVDEAQDTQELSQQGEQDSMAKSMISPDELELEMLSKGEL